MNLKSCRRNLFIAATDLLCVSIFLYASLLIHNLFGGNHTFSSEKFMLLMPLAILFINNISRLYGGHFFYPGIGVGKVEEVKRLTLSLIAGYILLLICLKGANQLHRYNLWCLAGAFLLTLPCMPLARYFCRSLLKRFPATRIKVLIAGAGKTGKAVAHEVTRDNYYGFEVAGFLDDDTDRENVCGKLTDAVIIAREKNIDYLILCIAPHHLAGHINQLLKHFRHILFVTPQRILPIMWTHTVPLGCTAAFEIHNKLQMKLFRVFKKITELMMALIILPFIFLLGSVIALLIKLTSPGPVLYRAERLGQNGKKIFIWKFRTMCQDADDMLENILENDPVLKMEWEQKFKLANDPRITPLGRFLRRTSLDELPQFWNVITGDMAIIGPRPIVEKERHYYGENFHVFSVVKPGITGLWQVSGRSDLDYTRRVNLDVYYVTNWTLWLDYMILLKTIASVFQPRGAC